MTDYVPRTPREKREALVDSWRRSANEVVLGEYVQDRRAAAMLRLCADQLEKLL